MRNYPIVGVRSLFSALWLLSVTSLRLCAEPGPQQPLGDALQVDVLVAAARSNTDRSGAMRRLLAIANSNEVPLGVRSAVVRGLSDIGGEDAREALKGLCETLDVGDADGALKWQASMCYWRLQFNDAVGEDAKREVLLHALKAKAGKLVAGNVQLWAAAALADRGDKEALPMIAQSIRSRNPGARGEEELRLITKKIDLLTRHGDRYSAYKDALFSDDPNESQEMRYWALAQLAGLGPRESRDTLIEFALMLRRKYFDEVHQLFDPPKESKDQLCFRAGAMYRRVIEMLRSQGLNDVEISSAGIKLDGFAVEPPDRGGHGGLIK